MATGPQPDSPEPSSRLWRLVERLIDFLEQVILSPDPHPWRRLLAFVIVGAAIVWLLRSPAWLNMR
jgi:hypothetical protein